MAEIIKDPNASAENDFLMTGLGSAWVSLENLSIYIIRENCGVRVHIYGAGSEMEAPLDSARAFFNEGPDE